MYYNLVLKDESSTMSPACSALYQIIKDRLPVEWPECTHALVRGQIQGTSLWNRPSKKSIAVAYTSRHEWVAKEY